MPASETQEGRRGGRLLTVVFWIGVGLAPLAALLVLVSSRDAALRVAAVLAILAVVLIGLSIMLRPDASSVRIELEETLLDEIDMLRDDVREDISTAARATHKAFSEKLQTLHQNIESLRGQVEAVRAAGTAQSAEAKPPPVRSAPVQASASVGGGMVGGGVVGGGVVRHTETVRETTRQTIVDSGRDGDRGGTVYGGTGGSTGGVYGSRTADRVTPGVRRGGTDTGEWGVRRSGRGDWETVDPRRDADADRTGEPWTDPRLRERAAEDRYDTSPRGIRGSARVELPRSDARDDYRTGDTRRPRPYDRDDEDTGADAGWSGARSDRWAAVRSDDRGRELRMGERRAAMHSDESGSEIRIEDRWAAVRHEESRTEYRGETRRERRAREEGWGSGDSVSAPPARSGGRRAREDDWGTTGSSGGGGRRRRDDDAPSWSDTGGFGLRGGSTGSSHGSSPVSGSSWSAGALPASPAEPASTWTSSWSDDREREPRRRRAEERDDRWDREEQTRGGTPRPRRIDFELTDDRWR